MPTIGDIPASTSGYLPNISAVITIPEGNGLKFASRRSEISVKWEENFRQVENFLASSGKKICVKWKKSCIKWGNFFISSEKFTCVSMFFREVASF
jgi:hypothetical protein